MKEKYRIVTEDGKEILRTETSLFVCNRATHSKSVIGTSHHRVPRGSKQRTRSEQSY